MSLLNEDRIDKCWYKLRTQEWTIEEFSDKLLQLPPAFRNDYNYLQETLEIPVFLENNKRVQTLLSDSKKLKHEASRFSEESTTEQVSRKNDLRDQLYSFYEDLKKLLPLIKKDINHYLVSESNFEELELYSFDNLKSDSKNESDKVSEFMDDFYALATYWKKITTGVEIEKAVSELGEIPLKFFRLEVQKIPSKDYLPKPSKQLSTKEIQKHYLDKLKEFQQERQQELNSKLKIYATYSTISEMPGAPSSYEGIKQRENRLAKDVKMKNVLYRIEQLQKRIIPLVIDFLAIQYALRVFPETLEAKFAEQFARKNTTKYSANAIKTFFSYYKNNKDNLSLSQIIEEAEDLCEELEGVSRGTVDNWIEHWNKFLPNAQQN